MLTVTAGTPAHISADTIKWKITSFTSKEPGTIWLIYSLQKFCNYKWSLVVKLEYMEDETVTAKIFADI